MSVLARAHGGFLESGGGAIGFVTWPLFLAEDAPPEAAARPLLVQLFDNPMLPLAGFLLIFYFIMIAPERRRKAEEAKRLSAISKNDRVITSGGLHATVVSASPDSDVVTIKLDDAGTMRVKISRWALSVSVAEDTAAKDSS